MQHACDALDEFGVPHEKRVVSAHRTPDQAAEYSKTARERGLEVIIAGAGGAAHLAGVIAAHTTLPVLGVPMQSKALSGHGLAAFDGADAGRHSRGHAGDRQGRRDECRAAGGVDPGD